MTPLEIDQFLTIVFLLCSACGIIVVGATLWKRDIGKNTENTSLAEVGSALTGKEMTDGEATIWFVEQVQNSANLKLGDDRAEMVKKWGELGFDLDEAVRLTNIELQNSTK